MRNLRETPHPYRPICGTCPELTLSKKRQAYRGATTIKASVRVSPKAAGQASAYLDGKKKRTVSVTSGSASFRLSKTLKRGTHKIRVVFTPATPSKYLGSKSKTIAFKVVKK